MLPDIIGRTHENSSRICSLLESVSFNSIRQVLPDRTILEACRAAGYPAAGIVELYARRWRIETLWKLPSIYRTLLREIADHRVPWRPGRNEPRMITREQKHYPSLKITRHLWKTRHAA